MKVIQVVPFIGAESSGPAYSVPNLCRALTGAGADVELHTLAPVPVSVQDITIRAYPRHRLPHSALGRSPEMHRGLVDACRRAEIIHNNSLWMMPNIYPRSACIHSACKLVISPRGTLAPWALERHSFRKKILGIYGQYAALKYASMFHATCQKEYWEIRRAGYRQPVAIIPNGMDIVTREPRKTARRKLVFFGRIHPVKAVDRLLLAWEKVADAFPQWDFIIAGPDGGAASQLTTMCRQRNIPRVTFVGEINGEAKYQFLADADLYALVSHTENFGMTVAEALASGTPVLVGDKIPWSDVEKHNCGKVSANAPEALAEALSDLLARSREELEHLGENGRKWMTEDFRWDSIGEKMLASYDWMLYGGERPAWIIVD